MDKKIPKLTCLIDLSLKIISNCPQIFRHSKNGIICKVYHYIPLWIMKHIRRPRIWHRLSIGFICISKIRQFVLHNTFNKNKCLLNTLHHRGRIIIRIYLTENLYPLFSNLFRIMIFNILIIVIRFR